MGFEKESKEKTSNATGKYLGIIDIATSYRKGNGAKFYSKCVLGLFTSIEDKEAGFMPLDTIEFRYPIKGLESGVKETKEEWFTYFRTNPQPELFDFFGAIDILEPEQQ